MSLKPTRLTLTQLTGLDESHLCEYQGRLIHHDVVNALAALQEAAAQAGFDLTLASAFRSFDRQLLIWNNKFNGLRPILDSNSQPLDPAGLSELEKIHAILRWSALPGASRHHWGTDLDVYAANCLPPGESLQLEPWEYQGDGHQARFNDWLTQHMGRFGFYRPYATDLGGVAIEPWHISYFPLSQSFRNLLTPSQLATVITDQPVAGKSHILVNLDTLYSKYINNICEV
ncbi:M15 family metallopeptidase [Photobacterium galatheae]|uniref:Peptidase M15 n=1 Tax=Photobacterium galatheae TaxID=1654360 RepID=A0A066RV53_9GAMM|nr:M15 family metallopeptidase [Photobacterium galatheae]KDM92996.1 peptidase M15 [Photobacterium galatheae]MCM0148477.1 M15 family metallopeptidase [Photobacterium galatheae]